MPLHSLTSPNPPLPKSFPFLKSLNWGVTISFLNNDLSITEKYSLLARLIISSSSFAGSCPMLWNKIDSEISKVTDESLKAKIQK